MATTTGTETKLKLEAPDALNAVQPQEAAGLIPLKEDERTALEVKVDTFIADLVATDTNSPEFGKKVDQLTGMGRKEIADAAGQTNRFLDRPVKAIDSDTGIGTDLTELAAPSRISTLRAAATCSHPGSFSESFRSDRSCATISTATSPRKATSPPSSPGSPRARTSC